MEAEGLSGTGKKFPNLWRESDISLIMPSKNSLLQFHTFPKFTF